MSDEKKQLDRIEDTLAQLIEIIGKTNAAVSELRDGQAKLVAGVNEIKVTVFRIEHRLNIMERKQDKMGTRLDTVEAELELIQDSKQ